jgi:hypothetical protein
VCTVDVTPRKCQKFRAKPGQTFKWTNVQLPPEPKKGEKPGEGKEIASGTVKADKYGLVTLEQVTLTAARHRLVIEKK